MRPSSVHTACASILVVAGCGSSTNDDRGQDDPNDPDVCAIDEPEASFTFRFRNLSPDDRHLNFGWSADWPLRVDVGDGWKRLSSWVEPSCGASCERLYAGESTSCTFGGPGSGVLIEPGGEARLEWDRRYFEATPVETECLQVASVAGMGQCAMPRRFDATFGVAELAYCIPMAGEIPSGWCEGSTRRITFELDPAADEVIVDLD